MQRNVAGGGVQLFLHHLPERFAIPAHRSKKNDKILHRTAEHHADQNPQRARQITKLRCQHRTTSGPGPEIAAK